MEFDHDSFGDLPCRHAGALPRASIFRAKSIGLDCAAARPQEVLAMITSRQDPFSRVQIPFGASNNFPHKFDVGGICYCGCFRNMDLFGNY